MSNRRYSVELPGTPPRETISVKFTEANCPTACALESQILDFQAAHVERRFRLPPNLAMIIAGHAFANGAGRL